jgi:hypothetical protein
MKGEKGFPFLSCFFFYYFKELAMSNSSGKAFSDTDDYSDQGVPVS